jgi:hypothetical protein
VDGGAARLWEHGACTIAIEYVMIGCFWPCVFLVLLLSSLVLVTSQKVEAHNDVHGKLSYLVPLAENYNFFLLKHQEVRFAIWRLVFILWQT